MTVLFKIWCSTNKNTVTQLMDGYRIKTHLFVEKLHTRRYFSFLFVSSFFIFYFLCVCVCVLTIHSIFTHCSGQLDVIESSEWNTSRCRYRQVMHKQNVKQDETTKSKERKKSKTVVEMPWKLAIPCSCIIYENRVHMYRQWRNYNAGWNCYRY